MKILLNSMKVSPQRWMDSKKIINYENVTDFLNCITLSVQKQFKSTPWSFRKEEDFVFKKLNIFSMLYKSINEV